jgi:cellulose synthase/poly-beta-1,6-N-acetylglucosamine synthase-like glycosyltransferase
VAPRRHYLRHRHKPTYCKYRALVSTHTASEPRVSVIIPVYGTAQFVAEAIESVLSQTYTNYEIFVINDGSPDSELLDKVLAPYRGQIIYIVQENRGVSGARNTALKRSSQQYVAMLDGDDKWAPEYLASQLSVLAADPKIDVVYPNAIRFNSEGRSATRYSDEYPLGGDVSFLRVLARECHVYGGVTARREALLRVGFYDENLRVAEDFDLWLRVLKAGGRIVYNDRVLAFYRMRPDSNTSNAVSLTRYLLMILDKAGNMALTAEERAILDRQRAITMAELNLWEGKQALGEGNFSGAIARFRESSVGTKSLKLRAATIGLLIAPRTFLRLYRLRERWKS